MAVKETFELLRPVVDRINKRIHIDRTEGNKIFTCNTLWLFPRHTFTVADTEYRVKDIEPNEWVEFESAAPVADFDIPAPFFFHGTILATNEELSNIGQSWNKFPMIYLHEITRERIDVDEESTIDRESECDLYFMTEADFQNWLTNDHYKYAVRPMRNLVFEFIKALKGSSNVGEFEQFTVMDQAKWGVYLSGKGQVNQIFRDNLSGTQLKINIPFLKTDDCCGFEHS
jgi:hypothetical protein